MNKLFLTWPFLLVSFSTAFLLSSCKTYVIPTETFYSQFAQVDSTSLKLVTVTDPFGTELNYLANPIALINCIDKKGNPFTLTSSPSIEMRVSKVNGGKTIFYFDRTIVLDSVLIGARSRVTRSGSLKSIPISEIKLIEIQDGKKKYQYSNKSN